ncbi:MAG: FHA domain-containing protein [Planctomycetia bacterium]|nr:FHA domain-containing protein [Planctomycetia bacterium]
MKVDLRVIDCETNSNLVTLSLPAVIGRGDNADLVIAHPEVSRQHCRLFWYQNAVHIQDLRSLNGTVVAGRRIQNAESSIMPEENFTVGPVQFRISYNRQDNSVSEMSGSSARRTRGGSTNAALAANYTHSIAATPTLKKK